MTSLISHQVTASLNHMPYHHVFLFVVTAAMTTGKCQILARLWSNRTLIHWWWDSKLIHSKMLVVSVQVEHMHSTTGPSNSTSTYMPRRNADVRSPKDMDERFTAAFTQRQNGWHCSTFMQWKATGQWEWFYFIKYKTIQKYSVLLELRRVVSGVGGEVVNGREHGGLVECS